MFVIFESDLISSVDWENLVQGQILGPVHTYREINIFWNQRCFSLFLPSIHIYQAFSVTKIEVLENSESAEWRERLFIVLGLWFKNDDIKSHGNQRQRMPT